MLTEDMILEANDYLPIVQKYEMAQRIAQDCVAKVRMEMQQDEGNVKTLPDRVQEAQLKTNLYLMGVLAKHYLKIPYDGENVQMGDNPYYGLQMPANLYDQFGRSHVLNQLEQMKGSKAVRDKVYNILYDYRKFQRMLNAEIETILGHQNDVVWRFMAAMEMDMKRAALDEMQAAMEKPAEGEDAAPDTDAQKLEQAREKLRKFHETVEKMRAMEEALAQKLGGLEAKGEESHA